MRAVVNVILGFLFAGFLAEVVLHALPVSTGYNLGPVNDADPILRGAPRSDYTYSRAWNFHLTNSGELNNDGFRSSHDYLPDPRALIVIGNSFVQADALEPRETLTERLGEALHIPAYAVGVDGFALPDYLAAARWATATFEAHTLLVLLTTGDLKHSCVRRLGEHYLRDGKDGLELALVERRPPSRSKQLLNGSSLFRYVFDNLRLTANWEKGWRRQNDVEPPPEAATPGCSDAAFERAATRFLLDGFHQVATARRARVVFLLAPGYRREQGVVAGATRDVDEFADRAAADGFEVVRLEDAFEAALDRGERLDFMPVDAHWNVTANALAARVAAHALAVP